jgi:flavin reductase (DIM6/NTAB) family NADH-FMN oxidoreductase RutF
MSSSDAATEQPPFDSAHFRQVLGHFPTGVTIITGMAADGTGALIPAGFTIGSFTSVSLEPPLVGFLPMVISDTWAAMAPSGKFCVNVLGAHHGPACWRFAKKGVDDRFADVGWHAGTTGSPILDDAIAWIDCVTEVVHEVGDHYFVVGRVVEMSHAEDDPKPLLFYRGKLGGFELHD